MTLFIGFLFLAIAYIGPIAAIFIKKIDYRYFMILSFALVSIVLVMSMQSASRFIEAGDWNALRDINPIEGPSIFLLLVCFMSNGVLLIAKKLKQNPKQSS